jgi:hypothetical protein
VHLRRLQVRQTATALRQQLKGTPGLQLPAPQQHGSSNNNAATDSSACNGTASSPSSDSTDSPLVHLQLTPALISAAGSRKRADALLQAVADRLLKKHGLLVAVPCYSSLDRVLPPPSIKLYVHSGLSLEQVPTVAAAVKESAQQVLGSLL